MVFEKLSLLIITETGRCLIEFFSLIDKKLFLINHLNAFIKFTDINQKGYCFISLQRGTENALSHIIYTN